MKFYRNNSERLGIILLSLVRKFGWKQYINNRYNNKLKMLRLSLGIIIFVLILSTSVYCADGANVVKITGIKGNWQLLVNGEIFKIKGVGVGRAVGKDGVDYLKMAQELGANTVRTWGVNQGDQHYLDKAKEYNLYVDAGIWLNPVRENDQHSYLNKKYLKKIRKEALDYVRKNKNHPSILFWNIGNEVIFWTKDEKERIAFCKFFEKLIKDVKKIDSNHPVIYTSAFTVDTPYIKKYVPSVDIIGINGYGGFEKVQEEISTNFDIPYIITEFGPVGNWDRNKDRHGATYELSDELKVNYYKQHAHTIKNYYGHCLGAFVFFLGDTTQVSLTWWNLNYGKVKKISYMAMEDFYKEQEYRRAPFIMKEIILSKHSLKPNEEFEISAELKNVVDPNSKIEYEYFASTASEMDLQEYPNEKVPLEVLGSGSKVRAKAPTQRGVYRIYAAALSEDYATTFNKSIKVE